MSDTTEIGPVVRTVALMLISGGIGYWISNLTHASTSDRTGDANQVAINEAEVKKNATPESYLNLSLAYNRAGRFGESMLAAREALRLRPDYAEAYNNIAADFEGLGLWDQAIDAAQQAIKLKPDFQLARNNLAYALAQKAGKATSPESLSPPH